MADRLPYDALSILLCRTRHQQARGSATTPVIPAPVIDIIAVCCVLWFGHAGLIPLQGLDTSRLLVTVKHGVWGWLVSLKRLQWRD